MLLDWGLSLNEEFHVHDSWKITGTFATETESCIFTSSSLFHWPLEVFILLWCSMSNWTMTTKYVTMEEKVWRKKSKCINKEIILGGKLNHSQIGWESNRRWKVRMRCWPDDALFAGRTSEATREGSHIAINFFSWILMWMGDFKILLTRSVRSSSAECKLFRALWMVILVNLHCNMSQINNLKINIKIVYKN